MPAITGLLETSVYVDDMARSVDFYREVMGLSSMFESPILTAFDAGSRGVLLVFLRGGSRDDKVTKSGIIPGHDGAGPLHMAFAIPAAAYDEWREHLTSAGVKQRGEMQWPAGGRSLYFEDPDGHLLEVATPGLWRNY